ncbi:DUF1563 domain-containing protein, partial [Leptospira interrogans]
MNIILTYFFLLETLENL